MVWHILPLQEGISWEGHLSGMIIGLCFALIFRKEIAKPKKYAWEQEDFDEDNDPFLKHFDENGNFIENIETDNEPENFPRIHYIFKKDED